MFDLNGNEIGKVLTCATDMAIGRHGGKIYSVATPDKPEGLKIKGLSCGFIKVSSNLRRARSSSSRTASGRSRW